MNINLTPEIALKLHTFARIYPKEFSGFGFVERDGENLNVYDIVLLDVGSETLTEIPSKKVLELMNRPDAEKMKLWFHKHPCSGWSGTDVNTIKTSPLGGIPELVKWSASIVLTPDKGWIGRVDSYKTGKMIEAEVTPNHHAWAQETLDEILASKPKRVFTPFINDDWEEDLDDLDDLDDRPTPWFYKGEQEEGEDDEDFEAEELSPYERRNVLRNRNLQQSSWFKRWFGR